MSTTLVTALRASLAEEEADALAADAQVLPTGLPRETHLVFGLKDAGFGEAYQGFVLVHDPARVLREVAAKRVILGAVFEYECAIDGEIGDCHSAAEIEAGECNFINPDEIPAVVALAEAYAGARSALAQTGKTHNDNER